MDIVFEGTLYKFKAYYSALESLASGSRPHIAQLDDICYNSAIHEILTLVSYYTRTGLLLATSNTFRTMMPINKIGVAMLLGEIGYFPAIMNCLMSEIQMTITGDCQHESHKCPKCDAIMIEDCIEMEYCTGCKKMTVALGYSPSEFKHSSQLDGGEQLLTESDLVDIAETLGNYSGMESVMFDIALEYGPSRKCSRVKSAMYAALNAKL